METKELIQALRADAEWAHANEWETPITLGDHLDAAADALAAYEDTGLTPEEINETISRFERFLVEMTGGRMSKYNYTLDAMISVANDYQQSACDECGDRQELAALKEAAERIVLMWDNCYIEPYSADVKDYIERMRKAIKEADHE